MQLKGATQLERRIFEAGILAERELTPGPVATTISGVIFEAGRELQEMRMALEKLQPFFKIIDTHQPTAVKEARKLLERMKNG